MPGSSQKQTQSTKQTTQQDPWGPTIPWLKQLLPQIGSRIDDTGLNQIERSALDRLSANAQRGNPNANDIDSLARGLLRTPDRTGEVDRAFAEYRARLNPTARGEFVNPARNPALQGYLSTISNDVQNRVNGMFAGAGRDLSGANMGTLARGITEGTAPILYDAYNTERGRQLGAVDSIFRGGMGATSAKSDLEDQRRRLQIAGIGASDAALAARNWGPQQELNIESMRFGLPVQRLGMLSGLLTPIAGLGGRTNSTSRSVTNTSQPFGLQQAIGAGIGGLGLLGGMGAFGPAGWLMSSGMGGGMGGFGGGGLLSSFLNSGFNRGTYGGTGGGFSGLY